MLEDRPVRWGLFSRSRRLAALAAVACLALLWPSGSSPAGAAHAPLSISILGRHFVDGSGHRIRLLGVNHPSAEYGCVDGFGYDDGHFDATDAAAIASWGADAVRIPLNEDCWLGLNGQPNSDEGADPPLTVGGYRNAIKSYVADLNAHGIYAILDLHWTAPGSQVALEQQPMPDQDHSPAFWASVAATFRTNPAVVFDLFNEPYDPTDPRSGSDTNAADAVTWNCWETGTEGGPAGGSPCFTRAYDEGGSPTRRYQVAGMQTLLDAVRNADAKQPVLVGGLDWANDLGEDDHGLAWMDHAPDDPLDREAASFHNYMGKECDHASCWKDTVAPVAQHVPVVTGEFDEDNFDEAKCTEGPSAFDGHYMKWADSAGVSYLAWGWIVESRSERDADGCSAFYLIDDYTHYRPAQPNGVAVHDHLRMLASTPARLTTFRAKVRSGTRSVAFRLRATRRCTGTLTGRTVHAYAFGNRKPHRVSLGAAVHFTLKASTAKTVVLELSRRARRLLAARHRLKTEITVTLTNVEHRSAVTHHVIRLRSAAS